MDLAKSLISNMTAPWQPETIVDEYTRLQEVIDAKVKAGGKSTGKTAPPAKSTQVINLLDALAACLKTAAKKPGRKAG